MGHSQEAQFMVSLYPWAKAQIMVSLIHWAKAQIMVSLIPWASTKQTQHYFEISWLPFSDAAFTNITIIYIENNEI